MQVLIGEWRILVLALIQGISEIFPISSSGHLVIFSGLFQTPITLNVVIFFHIGTFFAILVKYRIQVRRLLFGKFGLKLLALMVLSFLTTSIVGLLIKNVANQIVVEQANFVTFLWIVNGCILAVASLISPRGNRNFTDLKPGEFIIIGFVQGLTTVPGISRLGMTLVIGLLLGLLWFEALDLSFLLSLPTIFFANVFTILQETNMSNSLVGTILGSGYLRATDVHYLVEHSFILAVAMLVSFTSGLLSIRILYKYLNKKLLVFFGLYSIIAGIFFFYYLKLF